MKSKSTYQLVADSLIHLYYSFAAYLCTIYIAVDIQQQQLKVYYKQKLLHTMPISTGKNGTGEEEDTGKTPRGWHEIAEYHGEKCEANTYFVARIAQGKYNNESCDIEDVILSRILWLSGKQYCNNNTKRRYIYAHGTNETNSLGNKAQSHGCIRMHPNDIITLFDLCHQAHHKGIKPLIYTHDQNNRYSWQKLIYKL